MWGIFFFFLTSMVFGVTSKQLVVNSANGENFEVKAFYYQNKHGGEEIRLESALLPSTGGKINSIFGYGRDLDDDGIVDNWFLIDPKGGVNHLEQNCYTKLCEKTIVEKIFKNYVKSEKMVFYSAYATIVGFFFMSLDNRYQKEMDFYQEWIDLEELRIRVVRDMKSKNPALTIPQTRVALEMLSYGYEQNRLMLEKANGSDVWKYLVADVGINTLSIGFFKLLEKFIASIGSTIFFSPQLNTIKIYLQKFINTQGKIVEERMVGIKNILGVSGGQAIGRSWSQSTFRKAFRGALASVKIRTKFLKRFIPFMNKKSLDGESFRWGYVALSTGIQLGAETVVRWDDVKSDDPTEVAEKVLKNKDVLQNVAYMLAETFFMTTAVTFAKTVKMKFAICGMIAVSDSIMVNYLMKDTADHERVISDTSWELVVGSSQVILDNSAIGFFEGLAKKNHNPKLKFLGWAVAGLDQAAGYYFYSKVSTKVEDYIAENKKGNFKYEMVPVYASE
ncbi:MAG: hypothetical protein AB7I27_15825 [Bacteriovoracaceae bacterium]